MYTIMVIDDDSISLAISKALLGNDYNVLTMKSGLQALGYLKGNVIPDVILLDMIMPGTNGMETLKQLKSDERLREISVIFLTSMDDEKFQMEGYTNGAVDFLKKPIQPEILKMKVQRHLYIANLKKENLQLKQKLQMIKNYVNDISD